MSLSSRDSRKGMTFATSWKPFAGSSTPIGQNLRRLKTCWTRTGSKEVNGQITRSGSLTSSRAVKSSRQSPRARSRERVSCAVKTNPTTATEDSLRSTSGIGGAIWRSSTSRKDDGSRGRHVIRSHRGHQRCGPAPVRHALRRLPSPDCLSISSPYSSYALSIE